MEHKRDLTQDDIVDSAVGMGTSFGFFFLIGIIFTIVSVMQH